jgi:SEC-C motif-containing protein
MEHGMAGDLCPCGSGDSFAVCCKKIVKGKSKAATAEQVMRARYTAYVVGDIEFLGASLVESDRGAFDADGAKEWSRKADWQGLEILSTEGGGPDDTEGVVEFVARYHIEDVEQAHHERAKFKMESGAWHYAGGRMIGVDPYRREEPKVGRNEPCPCGSGKKFKKCCAR